MKSDYNIFRESKKKKKRKQRDLLIEDGIKYGVGLVGLGIGLHVLHDYFTD